MMNKIERNWMETGRWLYGERRGTRCKKCGEYRIRAIRYLASGVLDVVGQAPGVMYSK
ncbi:MAG: hypothetical protein ABIQ24_10185 [Nitrospiraceae bacterium]